MGREIFQDADLQKAFDKDGFVQISLLEPEDIPLLRGLFEKYMPDPPAGFFSSSYLTDFSEKKEISEEIVKIMLPRIARVFKNFRVFGAAFLSKNPGARSEMPMHQDWTLVDETEHVAVNIWSPLQDANQQNGSLQVLPGSHAFLPILRAPTLPFFFEPYQAEIRQNLRNLVVKATEVVVLNQAVVHASPPNLTTDCRMAITTGLLSADAPMRFLYQAQPDTLEVFDMEDDFLLRFENFHEDIFRRPSFGKSQGTIPFQLPKATPELIRKQIAAAGNGIPISNGSKSFLQRLGAFFARK